MTLLKTAAGPLMAKANKTGRAKVRRALLALMGDRVYRVRITPVMWDVDGGPRMVRSVLPLDGLGRELPTPKGGHMAVVGVLRLTFPEQWFDMACEYGVSSGELHRYDPPVPRFLRAVA
ncbi:hypothetical protein ACFVYT_24680 [Streptomyces sp. NPDC058290]|uniref:hypothetical protein n=1 Tax=Streptomyces sp. NPDC058290 TaxID=3346426 RepID=UPI0036F0255A